MGFWTLLCFQNVSLAFDFVKRASWLLGSSMFVCLSPIALTGVVQPWHQQVLKYPFLTILGLFKLLQLKKNTLFESISFCCDFGPRGPGDLSSYALTHSRRPCCTYYTHCNASELRILYLSLGPAKTYTLRGTWTHAMQTRGRWQTIWQSKGPPQGNRGPVRGLKQEPGPFDRVGVSAD